MSKLEACKRFIEEFGKEIRASQRGGDVSSGLVIDGDLRVIFKTETRSDVIFDKDEPDADNLLALLNELCVDDGDTKAADALVERMSKRQLVSPEFAQGIQDC